jgi:hypothetical protein
MRTVKHDPDDEAEVAAVQTPGDEPDGELIDPADVDGDDEESEAVMPE